MTIVVAHITSPIHSIFALLPETNASTAYVLIPHWTGDVCKKKIADPWVNQHLRWKQIIPLCIAGGYWR